MLTLGIASGEVRTWTDTTGKFKVEAEFVSLEDGQVTLRGATNKTKQIPLDKLSAADKVLAVELGKARDESIAAIEKLGGRFSSDPPGLHLENTKVTDAGLEHLEGMTGMTLLTLGDTLVTNTGVEKLQAALPKCKIMH